MATVQFKSPSPFIGREERIHDPSDVKYGKFLEKTSASFSSNSTVTFALFGVGRAGNIHLRNLIASSNVLLKYIVDSDQTKWDQIRSICGADCEIKHPDNISDILSDESLEACVICTPTFTHKDLIIQCLNAENGRPTQL